MSEESTITREKVLEKLKEVFDPEIPVNVVDLGLIYEVRVSDKNEVYVQMTLTAPGCGMGPVLQQDAEYKIKNIPGVKTAKVEVVWDPTWKPEMMTEAARLQLGMM